MPFLCASAVLDTLTEQPTPWVARLAPAQSHGWRIYADHLLAAGHRRIAVAIDPSSVYWASGARILRDHLAPHGGTVVDVDVRDSTAASVCDTLAGRHATALLLLVGHPEPAVSIVRSVRRDRRLAGVMIGAPAGQPEFTGWVTSLGADGAAVPFLRYLPERLGPLGERVATALRERLAEAPSFVAFEGYDTVTVLAGMLRSQGPGRAWTPESWASVSAEGTRGGSGSPGRRTSACGNGSGRRCRSWTGIRRTPAACGSCTRADASGRRALVSRTSPRGGRPRARRRWDGAAACPPSRVRSTSGGSPRRPRGACRRR